MLHQTEIVNNYIIVPNLKQYDVFYLDPFQSINPVPDKVIFYNYLNKMASKNYLHCG